MFAEPYKEPQKPKLKLEVVRGGGGGRVKTAIGCKDFSEPEPVMTWQEVPTWFKLALPISTEFIRNFCISLPMRHRDYLLRKSGFPRCYRVILSVRWKFITDEDFSKGDAIDLCDKVQLDTQSFKLLGDKTETQAVWRIWLFCWPQAKYPWCFKESLLARLLEE